MSANRTYLCIAIAASMALSAGSCRSSLQAPGQTASLTLVLPGQDAARDLSRGSLAGYLAEVSTWYIVGDGPGLATCEFTIPVASLAVGNVVALRLLIGAWTLGITGRDSGGAGILYRSLSVELVSGQNNAVPVVMEWATGALLARLSFDDDSGVEDLIDSTGRTTALGSYSGNDMIELTLGNDASLNLREEGNYAFFDTYNSATSGGRIDLTVDGAAALDLGDDFTLSLWVYPSSGTYSSGLPKQVIMSTQDGVPGEGYTTSDGFTLSYNSYDQDSDGRINFETADGSAWASLGSGSTTLALDSWQHLAVAVDKSAGTAAIYLNGRLVAESVGSSSFIAGFSSDLALRIGGMRQDAYFFAGCMDDVRIYGGALDAAGVADVMGLGPFSGGSGASGHPFKIASAAELQKLSDLVNWDVFQAAEYRQTAAINLASLDWVPIGTSGDAFTGVYDGGGYAISNLNSVSSEGSYRGLFGYAIGATLRGIRLTGVAIGSSSSSYVGGLLGYGEACAILDSGCSGGSVTGYQRVGGLVGYANGCTIQRSRALTSVSGYTYAGGLVGYLESGTLKDCYSLGEVSGNSNIGGSIGAVEDASLATSVSNCYTTAAVSATSSAGGHTGSYLLRGDLFTAASIYWCSDQAADGKDASGGETSYAAKLTAAQLLSRAAFAGWDFSTVWAMGANGPVLRWE